jgi:hypothetical protein
MLLKLVVLLVVGCRKIQPHVIPAYAPVFKGPFRPHFRRR